NTGDPDGWQQVVAAGFGSTNNSEIFRLAVFGDRLYAATWNASTGGEIWRSSSGGSGTWARVVNGGFDDAGNVTAVSLVVFDGHLYAGTYNPDTGTEVWRSDDGASWHQVNADGFGDADNRSVALEPFDGYLYAGTYNYYGDNPGAELWRCQQCDGPDWEQVSVDKGFGDTENRGIHALATFADALYAFTDNRTAGVEVWRTTDGTTWEKVGADGLGDSNNYSPYWDNSVAVFDDHLHVGTRNPAHGGEVWRTDLQLARADFTASITEGVAPLTVPFTNTSTGDYDTCAWSFGDGGVSTNCDDPSHEYTTAGVYTVTLAIDGLGGSDVITRPDYVTVRETYEVYLPLVVRNR
ncbi:MAG: hypothetical protein DRI48_04975, partial [Chloroflexi bacterium]